jgi:2-oxoglutarate dehydrogenase E2 component (dihydrolipoamide succinyltransferase)
MGESIAEGTITKWIKNVGDAISRDEPLFEISTDKVDAEIPSPAAGTLTEILVGPGQTVAVNTVVARIGDAGEKPAAGKAPEPPAAKAAESTATKAAESTPPKAAEPNAAKAPEPSAKPAEKPAAPAAPSQPPSQAPPPVAANPPEAAKGTAPPPPAPAAGSSFEERIRSRSSPLVRRIAADNQVTIGDIEGTGIAGRVTKNDILSFIDNQKSAPRPRPTPVASPAASPAVAAPARTEVSRAERDEVVAMSVMRRKIAERMVESRRTSAHVATVFSIDYSAIDRLRHKNRDAFLAANGVKLTYLPFIFQSVTAALKRFPELNASIDGEEII